MACRANRLELLLQGVKANPVAVVCPVGQSTDTVYFNVAGNFEMVETREVGSAAYIWRNLTSSQPYILCGIPATRLPLSGPLTSLSTNLSCNKETAVWSLPKKFYLGFFKASVICVSKPYCNPAGTSCVYGDPQNITSICFQDNTLTVEVYGHSSSLELPEAAQVLS